MGRAARLGGQALEEIAAKPPAARPLGRYAALVRMEGTIAPSDGISAARFNPVLADAFADSGAAGVAVVSTVCAAEEPAVAAASLRAAWYGQP